MPPVECELAHTPVPPLRDRLPFPSQEQERAVGYCYNCGHRVMPWFVSNARFDAHEDYCDRSRADIKKSISDAEDRQLKEQTRMHGENASRIEAIERDMRWMLRGVIATLLSLVAMVAAVIANHITWHM